MFRTKSEIQLRIKELRDELDARCKYGTIKMAASDGTPIPTEKLQNELFSLTYRLSQIFKREDEEIKP